MTRAKKRIGHVEHEKDVSDKTLREIQHDYIDEVDEIAREIFDEAGEDDWTDEIDRRVNDSGYIIFIQKNLFVLLTSTHVEEVFDSGAWDDYQQIAFHAMAADVMDAVNRLEESEGD
jgi:hypothetical protein